MNEVLLFLAVLMAGVLLGLFFFGGLWWTVRKGLSSNRPALWFFGSTLLRTLIVVGGFYLVGHGHWQRVVLCLLGFFLARLVVTRLNKEGTHAP